MNRRSKAGGEVSEARHRKALKTKRRDASKTVSSSAPIKDAEVARLNRELNEALEQQRAASEVLRVISTSTGQLDPVFQTILANATRICGANFGILNLHDNGSWPPAAMHNVPQAFVELRRREPMLHFGPEHPLERVAATRRALHIADVRTTAGYKAGDPAHLTIVELAGARTALVVPMCKEGNLIGAITIYRQAVRPFSEKHIELVTNFAAQAVIAIENARLLNELRQRTTDLTERTADLTEALEQQTATSEVLQVVSSSPGDLQPVFASMLESAARICGASFGNIFLWDVDALHLVATHNTPPALAEGRRRSPFRPHPNGPLGRLLKTKAVAHIADLAAEPTYLQQRVPSIVEAVELGGIRTVLLVPMLKEKELIGLFSLYRQEVRPFTDKQIELVQNFASQAVIAIENARLLNELRRRTEDLTEALEQQKATSDLLQVISGSPGNLEPVFHAMLENAVSICGANFGNMFLYEDDAFRTVAMYNAPEAYANARRGAPFHPPSHSGLGRLVATKEAVQIADLRTVERYVINRDPFVVAAVELAGIRTLLAVPMLKEGRLVGAIVIYRQEVRPFGEKQTELVKNFASQVVIAIENARLLNELRQRTTDLTERTADLTEALEQQTATSEVLQVISSSPGDLEPVFAAMLENAARICDANFGNIFRWDGDALHLVATHNTPPSFAEYRTRQPLPLKPNLPFARMVAAKAVVHCADAAALPAYVEQHDPEVAAAVELGGIRTFVAVPMLKENNLIGALIVYRQEVRPFTNKQIELVKNFAAQAVIAIENARLLTELRQSLEQQTATADVLKVVSRSTFDLQTVLEALVETAARLCNANMGCIVRPQGSYVQFMATFGFSQDFIDVASSTPITPGRWTLSGRVMEEGRTVHIHDVLADIEYTFTAAQQVAGFRSGLGVPLMREGAPIGVINLWRSQVQPFTEKEIELVTTFAAQAVIAIENARLLKELRDRTEEVEKLNQHLEQRVTDQVDEIERMSRLRRFLPPQVADLIVASGTEKQLESHRREITALFCDLRGFTGFTESADAEDVMALLRDYHAAIGEIIIKYNGTLERYAGDGVMVVFNDPVPVENPALQAVLMALEVRGAIGALTERWRRLGTRHWLRHRHRTRLRNAGHYRL